MLTLHDAIRLPLRAIPREAVVPIVSGPNRGCRWIAGASTHGCWIGNYERRFAETLASTVQPGAVVWDIGACVGYYTLVAARRALHTGAVYAFEPYRPNFQLLMQHIAMNDHPDWGRMSGHEIAVSDAAGMAAFASGVSASQGRLDPTGATLVRTDTIDHLTTAGYRIPTLLKIDVEGHEGSVLAGAAQTLRTHRPQCLIATHSVAAFEECLDRLTDVRYMVMGVAGQELAPGGDLYAVPY